MHKLVKGIKLFSNNKNLCLYHMLGIQPVCVIVVKFPPRSVSDDMLGYQTVLILK